MLEALRGIRAQEARHAIKMARIRACNMALFFAIMPVVSFITFAVVCPIQVPSASWHTLAEVHVAAAYPACLASTRPNAQLRIQDNDFQDCVVQRDLQCILNWSPQNRQQCASICVADVNGSSQVREASVQMRT